MEPRERSNRNEPWSKCLRALAVITSLVGDNERTVQTKQVLACFESKTEAMLKLCIACSSKVNEISLFKAKGKIEMFLRFSLQRDFEVLRLMGFT